MTFKTEDSGRRIDLANGMVRDTNEGKVDYTLILKGPMHQRWAELLTRGAVKYGKHNWCKALESIDKSARDEVKARFQESAMRHFMQWMQGDRTEDHAAAVMFNLNGYEAMLATDIKVMLEQRCLPALGHVGGTELGTPVRIIDEDAKCGDLACGCAALDAEIARGFGQSAYAKGGSPL